MTTRAVAGTAALILAIGTEAFGQQHVTSAATVRLRAESSVSSAIVAALPFGTELETIGPPDGAWLHVRTPAGGTGWVAAGLTRSITPETRLDVFESIVRVRLAREGDRPASWFQVVDFAERVAGEIEEHERAAQWAYLRLEALRAAASSLPIVWRGTHPHQDWVDAHQPDVAWFELSGTFGLNLPAVINHFERHAGARAAEDILWLAARTPFGGECEGWLVCYVNVMLMHEGRYLDAYPAGRHAGDATARVAARAAAWRSEDYELLTRDCPELIESIGRLRAIVASTEMPATADALAAIDQVGRRCASARRADDLQIH